MRIRQGGERCVGCVWTPGVAARSSASGTLPSPTRGLCDPTCRSTSRLERPHPGCRMAFTCASHGVPSGRMHLGMAYLVTVPACLLALALDGGPVVDLRCRGGPLH